MRHEYMERLNNESNFYNKDEDFLSLESTLTVKKYILPHVKGKSILEMGCAVLTMTKHFLTVVKNIDVVDGAEPFVKAAGDLLSTFKNGGKSYCSLFEDFVPERKYEAIILANTLHHLQRPSDLLVKINENWLTHGGGGNYDGSKYIFLAP